MVTRTTEHKVGESIVDSALERAKGHHQPYCLNERPQREYYVSNLAPTHGEAREDAFVSQIQPSSISLDFRPKEDTIGDAAISFDLYYRSVPTYKEYTAICKQYEQSAHIAAEKAAEVRRNQAESDDTEPDGGVESVADAEPETQTQTETDSDEDVDTDNLYQLNSRFFRRLDIRYEIEGGIDLTQPVQESERISQGIEKAIDDALDAALERNEGQYKATTQTPDPEDFEYDLYNLSESEFDEVIDSLAPLSTASLDWDVQLAVERRDDEAVLTLMNRPLLDDDDEHVTEEPYIFNPKISVEASVRPYEFNLLPEDFRYDQSIRAKGRNCSTHIEERDPASDSYRIETTATPSNLVYEFEFRDEYNDTDLDASFATLAGREGRSPTETLRSIETAMQQYLSNWRSSRKVEMQDELTEAELDEFLSAANEFEAEIERFGNGITILENESMIRRAFEAMNEVNRRIHEGSFDGWRLFQLVFIVSNLADIVTRDPNPEFEKYETDYDDIAEVLWFPTGGGKTEAYLGLVLFTLFFDRLRGKNRGVSAWIRFPLRLLSRQQKERFTTALFQAEQLRRQSADDTQHGFDGAGDEFSLGFFVGSQDTPNSIGVRDTLDQEFIDNPESVSEVCQVLDECPLCGSEVDVVFDKEQYTVFHHCTGGDDCLGKLPLYVIDHDIYRYVPSVLLGSLDKVAVMGMQPRFANLFGNFTTRCPKHGLGYSGACGVKHACDVKTSELETVEEGTREDRTAEWFDPIPSLHLIDEVHLLSEELGAYASHYETMYLSLCEKVSAERNEGVGGVQPKVLTSTATISKYERQMEHLFQKQANRFPEDGPALGETFYGEYNFEKVERRYLGLTPNNRTHLFSILDLIKQYHQVVRDYYEYSPDELAREVARNQYRWYEAETDTTTAATTSDLDLSDDAAVDEYRETIGLGSDEFGASEKERILDLYETSLVYFTNKREKETYRKSITKQINDEMHRDGYWTDLIEEELTADTEDPALINELENPKGIPYENRIDTVPATSFVGHGIDVDRFNFMLFFGYPSQTFQYIQASSRVGRQSDVPGFVLDVFRPFDKRDRHRYKYFEKLHEYLGRTVEPVPIDRWAKFSIERTFPGISKGILLQYYRPLMYRRYTLDVDDTVERANVQKAGHLYEMLFNDQYPEISQDAFYEHLSEAYSLDESEFKTNEHFRTRVDERLDGLIRFWNYKLRSRNTRGVDWPENEQPMRSLRDIGDEGPITPFDDFVPLESTLTQN